MREQLFDFLKRELIGPDPVPPFVQNNGEEILINEPPRLRYGAGILFPQAIPVQEIDSTYGSESAILGEVTEVVTNDAPLATIEGERRSLGQADDVLDANDDIVNLANAFLPSVMGFSCFVAVPKNGFSITIGAGRYRGGDITVERMGKPVEKRAYRREPLDTVIDVPRRDLPGIGSRSRDFEVNKDSKPTKLILNIRNRTSRRQVRTGYQLFTFSLVNSHKSSGHIDSEDCFFQVQFSVRSKDGTSCFVPYPTKEYSPNVEDEKSARLLYRNYRTFAVGHGCAPFWVENGEGRASEIRADVLPLFEMKPVVPARFADLQLRMYDLSDFGDQTRLASNLTLLCQKYHDWILRQEAIANSELTEEMREVANRHIKNCRTCLERIRDGVTLVESDPVIRRAFGFMNRAILTQQLRYRMKLREWKADRAGIPKVPVIQQPDISNEETWPDWTPERGTELGTWYPFQIAFILMNLRSIARSEDNDRKIVDLIWFPTGGGKTEAYLGLSAFTIFLKRLRNKNDSGTTVLMRYTLRLLTAQQYQRAASLICACELIRRENEAELGKERITIGLWVGAGLTPNTRADAVRALDKMSRGESNDNPFIILKCPWCGVQMGPVHLDRLRVMGYAKARQPSTVVFQCHNQPDCEFSTRDFGLPLLVIDEDIYESPPSLVIATIDKFAMLPWRPEARTLFGFRGQERISPPELVIQDELHLISGPLGSMAGHYETLIYELCIQRRGKEATGPKIIASTATITRAAQQIHALYGCGRDKVSLFPPQCIDAGESFFAYVDNDAPGRMYAGVHASGLQSHTTAQVRVMSALLQGTKSAVVGNERQRDPYWTIVGYFNSLRELGHAETLIQADIREYLNAMWIRKGVRKESDADPRRFVNRVIELTSRVSSMEISERLQDLETSYPPVGDNYPVDICLATNMISVGVDVQRLGLMTVIGQPKTTSEYIQATSRVGRSKEGPGLVVTIFNTAKPRDRSHYEHFYSYHAAIYSHVEPTSVTPFSAPVRERALHAVLVGLVRYLGTEQNRTSPQPLPAKALLDNIRNIIRGRVSNVDPQELRPTLRLLEERVGEWSRRLPPKYSEFYHQGEELPLMYNAGISPPEEWDLKSWPTLTSMRTVDVSCDAKVIERYQASQETL
jgi:hypothetical protein